MISDNNTNRQNYELKQAIFWKEKIISDLHHLAFDPLNSLLPTRLGIMDNQYMTPDLDFEHSFLNALIR